MAWLLNNLTQHLHALLSPPLCIFCNKALEEQTHWCQTCARAIQPIVSHKLLVTSVDSISVYAGAPYTDQFKKLVMHKHYHSIRAYYTLAELIWRCTPLAQHACDCLVPIPLHWTRHMRRGFNQAAEMALILSKKRACSSQNLLKRVRVTRYQASLTAQERAINLADAFVLNLNQQDKNFYAGKHLVLIDDLMTTGSTLKSAAKVLLTLKPASIKAFVACRAL